VSFFGDINKLRAMGEEMQQKTDVKAKMASAQTRMDAANASMAAVTAASGPLDPVSEARRVPATATVNSATQTGMIVNWNVMVEVTLLVMLPSGVPLPVTTTLLVPQLNLSRLQPGSQLSVTIDPVVPVSVRVDWNS
jgi:hypothetical protein